jgi:hypothetical protein
VVAVTDLTDRGKALVAYQADFATAEFERNVPAFLGDDLR